MAVVSSKETVTESTTKSYGKRLTESAIICLLGAGLVAGSCYLLWWNEHYTVRKRRVLRKAVDRIVSISPNDSIDPENQNKLVHLMSAEIKTEETITDDKLVVDSAQPVQLLRLSRKVQMYQWKENTEKKTENHVGGSQTTTTQYTYSKEWFQSPIISSDFKIPKDHSNPGKLPYEEKMFEPSSFKIGAFECKSVRLLNCLEPDISLSIKGNQNDEPGEDVPVHQPDNAGWVYINKRTDTNLLPVPEIGDIRVRLQGTSQPRVVSVLAKQDQNMLVPLVLNGIEIFAMSEGSKTAEEMFMQEVNNNNILKLLCRGLGFVGNFIGIKCMLHPLVTATVVIPAISHLVNLGTSVVAFPAASILSGIVITLAWWHSRPKLVLGTFIVVALVGGGYVFYNKSHCPAKTTSTFTTV